MIILINILTDFILNYIVNKGVIQKQDDVLEFYKYGIEITVSSIFNVLIILALSLIFNEFAMGILFLLVFIPLRQFTGGYHADTYLKCNLLFALCYISLMVFIKLIHVPTYIDVIILLCHIILATIAYPIENKNKPFRSKNQILRCKVISIFLLIIWGIISFIAPMEYKELIMRTLDLIMILSLASLIERRGSDEKTE